MGVRGLARAVWGLDLCKLGARSKVNLLVLGECARFGCAWSMAFPGKILPRRELGAPAMRFRELFFSNCLLVWITELVV